MGSGGAAGDPVSGTGGTAGEPATASGGTGAEDCPDGTETCPCYGNGTCNPGLVCASGLCVSLGTGGASRSGGAVGSGGETGSGGDATGGAGGATTDGCPGGEPNTGDACDFQLMGTTCDYGGTTCFCTFSGQGGPGGGQAEWNCDGFDFGTGGLTGSGGDVGSGGATGDCADGNACSTPGSTCTDTDDNMCFCNSSNEWQC